MLYLKGSNKEKKLKELHPEMYEYFKNVCNLQVRHMVKDLPSQYLFCLVCCLKTDCQHPVCTKGLQQLLTWFCGGPSIAQLPLPIADPERPYGGNVVSAKIIVSVTSCYLCREYRPVQHLHLVNPHLFS